MKFQIIKCQVIHLGTRKSFCRKMRAQKLEETSEQEKSEFVFSRKHFQATGVRRLWQQGRVLQQYVREGIPSNERLPRNIHVTAPDTSKNSSGTFVYDVQERLIQTGTRAEEDYNKIGRMKNLY